MPNGQEERPVGDSVCTDLAAYQRGWAGLARTMIHRLAWGLSVLLAWPGASGEQMLTITEGTFGWAANRVSPPSGIVYSPNRSLRPYQAMTPGRNQGVPW